MHHRPRHLDGPDAATGPLRTDDSGEMLLLMFGLTVLLLGIAGVLLHVLGRPLAPAPVDASQDAALAGAVVLRQQALQEGLTAGEMTTAPQRFDVPAACAAVARTAAAQGLEVAGCDLAPTGLTVVIAHGTERASRDGQAFGSAAVALVDTPSGCLALRASWGATVPAVCPGELSGPAGISDSASTR
jgi:hypothetical protein